VGRRGGADAGDDDAHRQQVAHCVPDLGEPLRVEREPPLEEDDRDPEVDQRLERVSESFRVHEPEPERSAEDPKHEQRQDRRQLEALGDHLSRDAEGHCSHEGREDHLHIETLSYLEGGGDSPLALTEPESRLLKPEPEPVAVVVTEHSSSSQRSTAPTMSAWRRCEAAEFR
jgi:hypothetical protein